MTFFVHIAHRTLWTRGHHRPSRLHCEPQRSRVRCRRVRSRHAHFVGGHNGYWFNADTVIDGLQRFVARERGP